MEKIIMPKPAVAEVLERNYIEARLHTDKPIPGIERIRELQLKFAESVANPVYVTVDPEKELRLGRYEGSAITERDEENFIQFLKDGLVEKVVQR
jgi:hypothetical protein